MHVQTISEMKRYGWLLLVFILLRASLLAQEGGLTVSPASVRSFEVNGVEFRMIKVEKGAFAMGAQNRDTTSFNFDRYAQANEYPVHYAGIGGDFFIGETEVTQQFWKAVMQDNPSRRRCKKRPVDNVTWDDVQVFLEALNRITGQQFRLPTEEEWEFAARGGNQSRGHLYSGSDHHKKAFWCAENSRHARRVGKGKPNELGIYDMSGNVWEWCQTRYAYYDNERREPVKGSVPLYVIRGGCWYFPAQSCRNTWRGKRFANSKTHFGGFRLCIGASAVTTVQESIPTNDE